MPGVAAAAARSRDVGGVECRSEDMRIVAVIGCDKMALLLAVMRQPSNAVAKEMLNNLQCEQVECVCA